jgi:PDZ domain-containing protein
MLPSGPLSWAPLEARPRRWWLFAVVPIGIIVLAAALSPLVTLPYYAIAPGSARMVDDLIVTPPDRHYPPKGEILLTTVSLRQVHPLGALEGWLDRDVDVVPSREILGPKTPPSKLRQQNLQLMDDSKQVAEVVALRRVGLQVPEHGDGALVAQIVPGSPAEGHLTAGEVVTSVDGKPVHLSQEAVDLVRTKHFGDTVRLVVDHGDGTPPRAEVVKLGGRSPDGTSCSSTAPGTSAACIGVELATKNHRFDLPISVTIDSLGIGGPSAGLAFTLGLIDQLTPGELTGGHKVAVTGTIEINGMIGPVGGVAQKTAAVLHEKADAFLVPADEYAQAKARAGSHLKVIKVTTLDEALRALGQLGGDVSALGVSGTNAHG